MSKAVVMAGIKYIQIFGVQRSSTSYTSNLVMHNSENMLISADRKHAPARSGKEIEAGLTKMLSNDNERVRDRASGMINNLFVLNKKMHPLIAIKNPYSWYQSICRWVPLYNKKFNLENWYIKYNNAYKSWRELLENPHKPFGSGRIVCYEESLKNPTELLNYVRDNYGVVLKNKIIIPDRMSSAKDDGKELKFFTEERKNFYLQDNDFGLSKDLLKKITELVDWRLMEFYNYKPKEVI